MAAPSMLEFSRRLLALVEAGERFAVATVISVDGSASARPGAKALIDERGHRLFGWVGGGCAESAVRDEALAALETRRPRRIRLDLEDEVLGVGMPCGGFMELYIEPVFPETKLVVLGHGPIAETLVTFGKRLGFHVTVNDPLASEAAFPEADLRVSEDLDYAKLTCDASTYVVITTQHKTDYEALSRVLMLRPAYVGLVASRKRSALLLERLHEDGHGVEALRRVSAPCGLDIGANGPEEIALAALAEVLQRRQGASTSGRPLREVKGVQISESGVEVPGAGDVPEPAPSPPSAGSRAPGA